MPYPGGHTNVSGLNHIVVLEMVEALHKLTHLNGKADIVQNSIKVGLCHQETFVAQTFCNCFSPRQYHKKAKRVNQCLTDVKLKCYNLDMMLSWCQFCGSNAVKWLISAQHLFSCDYIYEHHIHVYSRS